MDVLPSGTILRVKILDSIDSNVDRDGAEFRGVIVSSVVAGKVTVLHPDAEVRGIFRAVEKQKPSRWFSLRTFGHRNNRPRQEL